MVEEPVSLVDLAPTVLDLVGLLAPERSFDGMSLRPALTGGPLPRRNLYFEALAGSIIHGWSPIEGLRWGRWKLIASASNELFDLAGDAGELENLVDREPERVGELSSALDELILSITPDETEAQDDAPDLDPATQARLASLGYIGGPSSPSTRRTGPDPRGLVILEGELSTLQHSMLAEEWAEALDGADYVLGHDPTNRFALYIRALALARLELKAEALEAAETLLGHYPDASDFYDLKGQILVSLGRLDDAAGVFREGREQFPTSEQLAYGDVLATFEAGRTREACAERLPGALEAVRRHARLLVLRARCRIDGGDPEGALDSLAEAVEAGFRELPALGELEDFRGVAAHPRFEALVEAAAGGGHAAH